MMLRQRLPFTLARRTGASMCVLQVQCQPCSTLGDIRAAITALRAKANVSGGAVQLCISEDMRVYVEVKPSSFDSQPQKVLLEHIWQGSATTTVAEALRALQMQPDKATTTTSDAASTALPASPSPVPSSSPLSFDHSQQRRSMLPNATVVDVTRVSADETRQVMQHLERTYPDLKLIVRHTSGADLQGTKLHTFHVEMVPRRGRDNASKTLSEDTMRLVETFKGESVGESYNGCLRRALRDAFKAADLPYPNAPSEQMDAATLLSLYAQTWMRDGFQLCVSPPLPSCDTIECAVRCQGAHGATLASTNVPLTATGLRELLDFCEKTAAAHNPVQHAAARQRIQNSPLHLVLPRSHLRIKHVLRRLLYYHYGMTDSDVSITGHMTSHGVFTGEVTARLPALSVLYDDAAQVPQFRLARTTGTSGRKVMELAAVQAIQALFPEIFERQIAYHPEVREIQQSEKASASVNMAPHVSLGFEAQFRWAVQTIGADFAVESVLLKQNTLYPLWGVSTGSSTVWLTQLFLLRPSAEKDSANATNAASASPPTARELCVHAFDSRKSRSEQKAFAAALAKLFPQHCAACIKFAQSRNLLDADGAPVPFEGVQVLQDTDAERFAEALSTDPCLTALTPTRSATLQPLPEVAVSGAALASYWTTVLLESAAQQLRLAVRVRRTEPLGAGGAYTATCVTVATTAGVEEVEKVLGEMTASTELGALLAALEATQKTLLQRKMKTQQQQHLSTTGDEESLHTVCDDARSASGTGGESASTDGPQSVAAFLVGVPTALPPASPLQTCVEALGRLYGLRCAVRISQEGTQYTGELWGSFPVDSAVLQQPDNVAASPFILDRNFLLGRGHAESPFMAVVQAAQRVFESHVRVHQRAFHDAVVPEGVLHLQPAKDSRLDVLRNAVLNEIQATSDKVLTEHSLTLRFRANEPFQLAFRVAAGAQAITLEETVSRRLLDCARELCTRVSGETGVAFLAPAALSGVVAQTPLQLLEMLCTLAYGFPLRVEVRLVHRLWHCRLSVPLTGELACCVAESTASRKKDAVDAAAAAVLKSGFAEACAQVPSHAVSILELRGGGAEETATETSLSNYVFLLPETQSDGTHNLPQSSK